MKYAIVFDASGTAVGCSSYWSDNAVELDANGKEKAAVFTLPENETEVTEDQFNAYTGYALVNGAVVAISAAAQLVLTQAAQRDAIADARYPREVGGVKWGAFFIATDRESQGKISQEVSAITAGLRTDPSGWKCLDLSTGLVGFRSTTNAEMQDISATTYKYVRACFQREDDLLAAVTAGTYTADMLTTGWPDNGATASTTTTEEAAQ